MRYLFGTIFSKLTGFCPRHQVYEGCDMKFLGFLVLATLTFSSNLFAQQAQMIRGAGVKGLANYGPQAATAPCQQFSGTFGLNDIGTWSYLKDSQGHEYLFTDSEFPTFMQAIHAAANFTKDIKGFRLGQSVTIDAAVVPNFLVQRDALDINCK
jgi:hypothetical protein